jgi:tRNA A-37 threonylcarbamoyl transferase component Bud32
MSTPPDGEAAALSPSQVLRVDEVCLRFEAVWKASAGTRPRLEQYLGDAPPPARRKLLHELLVLELAYRRREGELPAPEEYAPRFPGDLPTIRAVFAEAPPPSPDMIPANQDAQTQATLPPKPPGDGDTLSAAVAIPGYEVQGELGRGGMGVVYKARQVRANRIVALKMILTGVHAAEAERRRFLAEAEAVARVQHPNIVQIHEVGEHDGHPYFSLEFCPGGSLAAKLDGTPLPPPEAAGLVEVLARAVQAAHEAGVIHRDLKPANVLLAADGTPKVTDFGLAKKLGDAAGQTASGAIVGTPSYMAPEQAAGQSKEVGAPADVYALGAVLYECPTGRPPFKAATPLDTMLQVVGEEPVPPRQLQPKTPVDLETICLKRLQKEPRKRYAGATTLAEDLRRFQAGEPISARPVSALERAVKWARRRPTVAALYGLLAAVLILGPGGGGALWLWWRAETALEGEQRAKMRENEARDRLDQLAYVRRISLAEVYCHGGQHQAAGAVLDECPPERCQWEWRYLKRLSDSKPGENSAERTVTVAVPGFIGQRPPFSPDGRQIAGGNGTTVKVWETTTGRECLALQGHADRICCVAYSPDGKRLVSGSKDGVIKVWDAAAGQELLSWKLAGQKRVFAVAISPDSEYVACQPLKGPGTIWSLITGQQKVTLQANSPFATCIAFSPTGDRLAGTDILHGRVTVWDAATGQELIAINPLEEGIPAFGLTFSPDGKQIACGRGDKSVKVWDAVTGREEATFYGHTSSVYSVAFSPDGKRLVSGSADGTVKLWDVTTARDVISLQGPVTVVYVSFSADGNRIVSGSSSKLTYWDADR